MFRAHDFSERNRAGGQSESASGSARVAIRLEQEIAEEFI
jgi:hypothetical protein